MGLVRAIWSAKPLVLIHAPLYYHLAALLAWPLKASGLDSITAARLAGRGLSLIGLLLTGWSAFRIARLDGAPVRAGWWAACLVACAPVVGTMPYTVRPDMLGVGIADDRRLAGSEGDHGSRRGGLASSGGFAAFGLAICVKQHFVGGLLAATVLLIWECRRGRISPRAIFLGLLSAAAIVAAVYGTEELATDGRMSQAMVVAAAATTRVHPSDWVRAASSSFQRSWEAVFA